MDETLFQGKIIEYNIDGDKVSFLLDTTKKEKLKGTYYVKNKEEKELMEEKIKYGIIVEVNGNLEEPRNNTIPNTFNYKKYLNNQKIFYTINVSSINFIKEESFLYKIKNSFIRSINKIKKRKEYILAFVVGNKKMIDNEVYDAYKNNGVTHLFAISGMHIALFSSLINKVLKKLKIKENKRLVFISLFLIFYAFITGFSSSIKRALVFVTCNTLNKIFKLNLKTIDILYISLIILIGTNRYIIYDVGFLYSAIISFGIIKYNHLISSNNKIIKALELSLLTFLFSLPLSLYNYYEVNFLAILNNLYYIPWISLIIYPMCLLTTLFHPLCYVLEPLTNLTETITLLVSKITVFKLVLRFSFEAVIIYYILLFIVLSKKRKYLLLIALEILILKIRPYFDSNAYVYYLDVGQGDSAVIITPYQKEVLMIDTGGKISYVKEEYQKRNKTYNLSDNTITFLKSLGITKLDKLIISHGDFDHMGEAENLVYNFKIKEIIFNCGNYNELENELIGILTKKKIAHYSCPSKLNLNNNTLYFLNNGTYDNENDNSNVIYAKFGNHSFLFMGDASIKVEENLLKKYNLSNVDVLKIGHHGSDTSSSKVFINKIKPRTCLISVGRNNRYGHPKRSVLDTLSDCDVYRTDNDGTIKIILNKDNYKIRTTRS